MRARLAWAGIPGILLFVDGGLALTDLKGTSTFTDTLGALENGSGMGSQVGWTAGAGAQVPITRNLIVKAEYLYLDLGSVSVNGSVVNPVFPTLANGLNTTQSVTAHVLRLGVNYRF